MICLMPQCGYLSETSRMIEIHRALVARGAEVRMAVHGGTYEWLIRRSGIDYDVVGPHMTAQRSAQLVRDSPGLGDVRQSVYTMSELLTYARAEAAYFRRHGVRAVVTGFTLTTLLSSRLAGIPVVTEHNGSWLPPVWEAGLLPVPAGAAWPWMRAVPRRAMRRLVNAAPARVRWYTGPINAAARTLGVEPVPSMAALTLGDVALLTELPDVVGVPAEAFGSWRVGNRRGYRAGTRLAVAGPIYARLPIEVPPDIASFLDEPGPRVYVAMTSSPIDLVRGVVRRVAATGARVIVAGTTHEIGDLAGPRVRVAAVLPSHRVMPRVDLAVTTAGQGSMQTAMASGTPVIGIPLQAEQDLNVAVLERLGAARSISRANAPTARLTRMATAMLADVDVRRRAQGVKELYDRVDGAAKAAEIIGGVVDSR